MRVFRGYSKLTLLSEDSQSLAYRAHSENLQANVLLKVMRNDYPTVHEIARFRNEFEILSGLEIEGVPKAYALERFENAMAIVTSDSGGTSLNQILRSGPVLVDDFFSIAVDTVRILGLLHENNIVHTDLKPEHIIYNQRKNNVELIEFSYAFRTVSQDQFQAERPAGSLAYISPEQTGRINRPVDHRTDFYTLGISFYEMLTGRFPFDAKDAMELIHAHIAKTPDPIHQILPSLPAQLSRVVQKMMSKSADERYQSAYGLLHDLKLCREQWLASRQIIEFDLGLKDQVRKFVMSQKLYGREFEVEQVRQAFIKSIDEKSNWILIGGDPGVGKTALVHEIRPLIAQRNGHLIMGKYDQYHTNVPFSAITQAFNGLISQILSEPEEKISFWRKRILDALGDHGSVITDAIPNFKQVIGEQPAVEVTGPTESRVRFNTTFLSLLGAVCDSEHPLVVFLDDLQWFDSASQLLLENVFMQTDLRGLLFVGSYRDRDITAAHPFAILREQMRQGKSSLQEFNLKEVSIGDVEQLTADSLGYPVEEIKDLAQVLFQKSGGNPFFIRQIFQSLYHEKLLVLSSENKWTWDLKKIRAVEVAGSLVEILNSKIRHLNADARKILLLGACFGSRFELKDLSVLNEQSDEVNLRNLRSALEAGLIFSTSAGSYRFIHDRVHEAAYKMMRPELRREMHCKIGQRLLQEYTPEERKQKLFYVVSHLNSGLQLIKDPVERLAIAGLNLEAAQKAKEATVYSSALEFSNAGLQALPEIDWQADSELLFALYLLKAECEYLIGNFKAAEQSFDLLQRNTIDPFKKAEAYIVSTNLFHLTNNYEEAIAQGLRGLQILGVTVPRKQNSTVLNLRFLLAMKRIKKVGIANLSSIARRDARKEDVIQELLNAVGRSSYFTDKSFWFRVIIEAMYRTLRYGPSERTSVGLIYFGLIAAIKFGRFADGEALVKAGVELAEAHSLKQTQSIVFYSRACFLNPWVQSPKVVLHELQEAFSFAARIGDIPSANFSALFSYCYAFFYGENLQTGLRTQKMFIDFIGNSKDQIIFDCAFSSQMLQMNLLGRTKSRDSFSFDGFSEDEYLLRLSKHKSPNPTGYYALHKMMSCYFFGNYDEAQKHFQASQLFSVRTPFSFGVVVQSSFSALLSAQLCTKASSRRERHHWLGEVKSNLKKLKNWRKANLGQALVHELTVQAELYRLQGHDQLAMRTFDDAIQAAQKHDVLYMVAIANELAGKFYASLNMDRIALVYLRESKFAYDEWGAVEKSKQLIEIYPQLLSHQSTGKSSLMVSAHPFAQVGSLSAGLDISSIMKSVEVLSQEFNSDQLLIKMIRIMIENAGAQQGSFVTLHGEELKVEVTLTADGKTASEERVCAAIIEHVAKTAESLVLDDAAASDLFQKDRYILQFKPKSVLCMPVFHHQILQGLIYLENNEATSIFTEERLELLKILSVQAAISIENARLYSEVAEKARMQAELETARMVQETLFPIDTAVIESLQISGHYEPATECGGDWWHYHQVGSKVFVYIGDATGHGAAAALVTSASRAAVSLLSTIADLTPSKAMGLLNRAINETSKGRMNMTFFICAFDTQTGLLTYSNASHEQPFIVPNDFQMPKSVAAAANLLPNLMEANGPRLGENLDHVYSEASVQISPGDLIMLYSDGIRDITNKEGREWGNRNFLKAVLSTVPSGIDPDEVRSAILREGFLFRDGEPLKDDVTFVALRYLPLALRGRKAA
jgi:predicted ATPase/serine phosphatase RsbU (regulator of sigma subunit)